MIYLASPYSTPTTPRWSLHRRFEETEKATAGCFSRGFTVFSPIVYCHQLAATYRLPRKFEFWKYLNLEMLDLCHQFWILTLPGWDESVGVRAEAQQARSKGRTIFLLNPKTYKIKKGDAWND